MDDPVGCIPTHFFCAVWGLIAVGLLAEKDSLENFSDNYGVFKGGKWDLMGVQLLASLSITAWAALATFLLLLFIDKVFYKLRMPLDRERDGADVWEHGIHLENAAPICNEPDTTGRDYPALFAHNDKTDVYRTEISVHNRKRLSSRTGREGVIWEAHPLGVEKLQDLPQADE